MSNNKISAKIVADSINKQGDRITSFLVVMPRIVLAEWNTHRIFSRNSASSRAIPFQKMLDVVKKEPFIPLAWQQDHSGMQGTKYIDEFYIPKKIEQWLAARDAAVNLAEILNSPLRRKTNPVGINTESEEDIEGTKASKQICNRLLEPFAWHTVLVTATDYENFFALRANDQAEIHIQDLAYKMLNEYNNSTPKLLNAGEWHLPYADDIDYDKLEKILFGHCGANLSIPENSMVMYDAERKISIARCARTSYITIDTQLKHDYEKDLALYDKLKESGHYSPFEHIAKTMNKYEYENYTHTYLNDKYEKVVEYGWCGNFRGFIQYRKTLKNENQKDSRVIIKRNIHENILG